MAERFLIVSLGSIGQRHLRNLRMLKPQAEIGVLHLSGKVPQTLAPGVNCAFSSLAAARAFSPTAAIVCSPATTHLEVAHALLTDGVPVLLEKPMAQSTAGLTELIALARSQSVALMTGYNLRFLPSLIKARELVGSGSIGEVLSVRAEVGQYLPDWRPQMPYQDSVSAQRALGGGVLLELSHEIDYIYWLFGMPSRVFAMGGHYSDLHLDVQDIVSLCLDYQNPRRLVTIHLDFLQRAACRTCKFIGAKGTLVWDGIAESIALYDSERHEWSRFEVPAQPDKNSTYINELQYFLQMVQSKGYSAQDASQGYDVLRIVEAAAQSLLTQAAVEVV